MNGRQDRSGPGAVTWAGLAVVLTAAAVLSFSALAELAVAVRIPRQLGWLLPVCTDAGVAVATAVWLGGRHNVEARRFARRLTWALLLLTVAGNAAHQGLAAAGVAPPWWAAVVVGAIPPGVVGAVVHLAVLVSRGGVSTTATPALPAVGDHPGAAPEGWEDRAFRLVAENRSWRELRDQLDITEHYAKKVRQADGNQEEVREILARARNGTT